MPMVHELHFEKDSFKMCDAKYDPPWFLVLIFQAIEKIQPEASGETCPKLWKGL